MAQNKKVMVSGCFDLLHAGHIAFFETAASCGDLYVCIGTDENIRLLKQRGSHFGENERLYMVQSIRHVKEARLASGSGYLDYEPDMAKLKPDIFIVNEDGDRNEKRALCLKYGVEYRVLPRIPGEGLPTRSSSAVKAEIRLPFRLCLAGGWMDQPFINQFAPGSVVTVQIDPRDDFMIRAGLATSSRKIWEKLLKYNLAVDDFDFLELAKILFGCENPPGTKYVSGSQDAIGLTHPGINRLDFDGQFWPECIESCVSDDVCDWLEQSLVMIPLSERPVDYDPLIRQNITHAGVQKLALTGRACYEAILQKDIRGLGASMRATHDAWRELLPLTTSPEIDAALRLYDDKGHGCVTSGCGGGYILLATDQDIPEGFRIKVRR